MVATLLGAGLLYRVNWSAWASGLQAWPLNVRILYSDLFERPAPIDLGETGAVRGQALFTTHWGLEAWGRPRYRGVTVHDGSVDIELGERSQVPAQPAGGEAPEFDELPQIIPSREVPVGAFRALNGVRLANLRVAYSRYRGESAYTLVVEDVRFDRLILPQVHEPLAALPQVYAAGSFKVSVEAATNASVEGRFVLQQGTLVLAAVRVRCQPGRVLGYRWIAIDLLHESLAADPPLRIVLTAPTQQAALPDLCSVDQVGPGGRSNAH